MGEAGEKNLARGLAEAAARVRDLGDEATATLACLGATCRVDGVEVFEDTFHLDARGSPRADGVVRVAMSFGPGHEVHDAFGAVVAGVVDAEGRVTARVEAIDLERFVERLG